MRGGGAGCITATGNGTPAEFGKFLAAETDKWGKVVSSAKRCKDCVGSCRPPVGCYGRMLARDRDKGDQWTPTSRPLATVVQRRGSPADIERAASVIADRDRLHAWGGETRTRKCQFGISI
jgi:hypothetical protein